MQEKTKIFTIPNLMSFLRLLLIPVFVYFYHFRREYGLAILVLAVSYLTDLTDGFVARRLHQVSDLGKMLDPVADKLVQAALMICLVLDFPILWLPLIVFIIKECINGLLQMTVIRRSGEVHGAELHGKITTWIMDGLILIHVLWHGIPFEVSLALSVLCIAAMIWSLVLYIREYWKLVRS